MSSKSPFAPLLSKLSGVESKPKRARQGWQQLSKNEWDTTLRGECEKAWAQALVDGKEKEGKKKGFTTPFRQSFVTKKYNALSIQEQDKLKAQARKEKDAAVKNWDEEMKKPVSTLPEDRQKYVRVSSLMYLANEGLKMSR